MEADHRGVLASRLSSLVAQARGPVARSSSNVARGILALALLVAGSNVGRAEAEPLRAAFLLIDGATIPGHERLTGCDHTLSGMHARLDQRGVANTLLVVPSTDGIRQELLRFAAFETGTPHAVLFCGYVAINGSGIFVLGSDTGPHDNLDLDAVSVSAFSRVAGSPSGLVALDLHASAADEAAGHALATASNSWAADNRLPGRKLAAIDRAPDAARLIAALVASASLDPTTLVVASEAAPQPSPPAAAPVRPEPLASVAGPTTGSDAPDAPSLAAAVLPAPAPSSSPSVAPPLSGASASARPAVRVEQSALKPATHIDRTIRRVQVALLARGLYAGSITGADNSATRASVRRFQASIGHATSGRLTPDELKMLLDG